MKSNSPEYRLILVILFTVWIWVPIFITGLSETPKKTKSVPENRMLAAFPEINLSHLDPFPSDFSKYFNDHFPGRDEMISFYSRLKFYYLSHQSPVPDEVIVGKGGWLYKTANERMVYEGRHTLYKSDVSQIAEILHERALYYQRQGITFYLTVAPMKCEIYPEHLPAYYSRNRQATITDIILERLRSDTLLKLIELKDTLLANKKNGELYYRTDNHWNGLGAFYVYRTILNRMKKDFPQLRPLKRKDLIFYGWKFQGGNLAGQAGLWPYMKEMIFYPVASLPIAREERKSGYIPPKNFGYPSEFELVRSTTDTSMPDILVIRDSFFTSLLNLFSENFHHSVFIFDGWQYGIHKEIINDRKPDIVLLEIFEPQLPNILTAPR